MTTKRIRRPSSHQPSVHQPQGGLPAARTVRDIQVGYGLPEVDDLVVEIKGYWDVLLGRSSPPTEAGDMTLMEIANAYLSRALEIDSLIHEAEREGGVFKGSHYYRFRTGELRDFIEVAKKAQELGSRRLTQAELEFRMQQDDTGLRWSD